MTLKKSNEFLVDRASITGPLTRRTFLLVGSQFLLGSAILARLGYLDIVKRSHYSTLSSENRVKLQFSIPQRGMIYDRCGIQLAANRLAYRLLITPSAVKTLNFELDKLSLHSNQLLRKIKELVTNDSSCLVLEDLSWDEACTASLYFPSSVVRIHRISKRFYSYPLETAHFIGFVQAPSKTDKQDRGSNLLPKFPSSLIGKTGIEQFYNSKLQGQVGYKEIEVDAHSHYVRDLAFQRNKSGTALTSSIDLELQKKANDLIAKYHSGSVIVMDAWTGEVIVCASYPSFDNNLFTRGISKNFWRALQGSQYKPFTNKCIQGLYEPASIFKSVVALSGLEASQLVREISIQCRGYVRVGNHYFHCWKKEGHGPITLKNALAQSCDIYFYEIGQVIGYQSILNTARILGLGQRTNIDLPGEWSGLVPSENWTQRRFRRPWQRSDTYLLSIGQGSIMVTPIQLAVLQARIITRLTIEPSLLRTNNRKQVTFKPISISKESIAIILSALSQAINESWGTGYKSRIIDPHYAMGGKTGTGQVRRISMRERKAGILKDSQLPRHLRDHALFLGYAPVSKPRFVCSVIIEHGGSGGHTSVPIARDVLFMVQKKAEKNS